MEMFSNPSPVTMLVEGILALCFYLLPAIIAVVRRHPSRIAILVFNIVLGLTVFGWFVVLAAALVNSNRAYPLAQKRTKVPPSVGDKYF